MTNTKAVDTRPKPMMLHALARNWWLLLLRGIAAIVFGLLAFIWPGITVLTLVILYGAYALTDGIFAIIAAFKGAGGPTTRWWLIIVGLLGVAAGIVTFLWPGLTALTLLILIGAWAVVRGVFEIIGALRLREEIDNEWLLVLNGALSVAFGAFILIMPGAGALALIWVIGAFAIASGVMLVALAFKLKGHSHG